MFWTDWGSPGKVERAYMDGTGRMTLADTSLVWPNDITIDYGVRIVVLSATSQNNWFSIFFGDFVPMTTFAPNTKSA